MDFEIRKATPQDVDRIFALYTSRIGTKGCTWDEEYPSLKLVQHDIERGALYAVYCGDKVAAAAVCGMDKDLHVIDLWGEKIKNPCELERVGVLEEYQGNRLVSRLLRHIERDMTQQGFDGMRLLVSGENDRARVLYEHLGFLFRGEAFGWGTQWSCYEKQLTADSVQL